MKRRLTTHDASSNVEFLPRASGSLNDVVLGTNFYFNIVDDYRRIDVRSLKFLYNHTSTRTIRSFNQFTSIRFVLVRPPFASERQQWVWRILSAECVSIRSSFVSFISRMSVSIRFYHFVTTGG